MKKTAKNILIFVIAFACMFPVQAYAVSTSSTPMLDGTNVVEFPNVQSEVSPRVTGLIVAYDIGIQVYGNSLNLVAEVICSSEVVKCGFKEIIIQRRFNSSDPWTDYMVYEDMYDNASAHIVGKSIPYSSAYDYRATCVFYAKKNLILTQKIDGVSNII